MLAGRRLKKRSLLKVNEHFSDKPDDADAPLSQEISCQKSCYVVYHKSNPLGIVVKPTAQCGLSFRDMPQSAAYPNTTRTTSRAARPNFLSEGGEIISN